ncbi:MAG: hypothetical protein PHI38_10155 [Sulfurimonas sp.]|uniref:hypothetical protein n=1 Tax=Sulfurimonas sp. TaxID=2022749 RepID=UPI002618B834|nr:hypothetical protein [Sulfurimonas sp.]MDD3477220.1 hypothetical protein [Sulfurimonas sp.]
MAYYLHTEEAVVEIMHLRTTSEVSFYKKRALENGEPASIIKGGIEYFDITLLEKTKKQAKDERKEQIVSTPVPTIAPGSKRKTRLSRPCFEFEY